MLFIPLYKTSKTNIKRSRGTEVTFKVFTVAFLPLNQLLF